MTNRIARLIATALIAAMAFVAIPAPTQAAETPGACVVPTPTPEVVPVACAQMLFSLIESNADTVARAAESCTILREQNDILTTELAQSRTETQEALALADRRKVRIYELRKKIWELQRRLQSHG